MAKNITFKKDQDKQRIDELLAGKRIRNRMPEKVRGKCAPMVLWAIEYLAKLIEGGVGNLQSELFTGTSEEAEVMTSEIERLQAENKKLRERMTNQAVELLTLRKMSSDLSEQNSNLSEQLARGNK